MVISGVGGLGHIAIQYAKAMGLHVVAVDLGPEKWRWRVSLELKSRLMRKRRIRLQRFKSRSAGDTEFWSQRFRQLHSSRRLECSGVAGRAC